MNSRSRIRKIFLNEGRRNVSLAVLAGFTLFMSLPMSFFMEIQNFKMEHGIALRNAEEDLLSDKNELIKTILYQNLGLTVALGVLAILNGLILFGYLHSKRKQDFYFSQPMQRKTLFWCGFLHGIVMVVFPYILNLLLVVLISVAVNCFSGEILCMMLYTFATNMLIYLSIYALTVLAVIITGKKIFSILVTIGIGLYFPIWEGLFDCMDSSLREKLSRICNAVVALSPFSLIDKIIEEGFDHSLDSDLGNAIHIFWYDWKVLLGLLLMTILFIVPARVLYGMRKVESAGESVVFPKIKCIIKVLFLLQVSMMGCWYLPDALMTAGLAYHIIGFIAGLFLGLFVLENVLEQSWTALFRNRKKQYGYIGICFLFLIGIKVVDYNLQYHGFQDISENVSREELLEEGYLIYHYSMPLAGKDNWERFVEECKNGIEGKIHIAYGEYEDFFYCDIVYENGTYKCYASGLPYDELTFQYIDQISYYDSNLEKEMVRTVLCNKDNLEENKKTDFFIFAE